MGQQLIIQPRMPGVVQAADMTRCIEDFDRLFPAADVVDFTNIPVAEQPSAVERYMDMYHCRGAYQKSPSAEWRLRRLPDRMRRAYYWAALCDNDPKATQQLFMQADWDERLYQTNLLLVSNSNISDAFLNLKITEKHRIRYDDSCHDAEHLCNIFVWPKAILNGLSPTAKEQLVHNIAKIHFLASHDDGHCIINSGEEEGHLRAMTAAMFQRMPLEFRQEVIKTALNCLDVLAQPESILRRAQLKDQITFWHGCILYTMQYLFRPNGRITQALRYKITDQHNKLVGFKFRYTIEMIEKIYGQLGRDKPANIHDPESQKRAISVIQANIAYKSKVTKPLIRVSSFLNIDTPAGNLLMPPPEIKKSQINVIVTPAVPLVMPRYQNVRTSNGRSILTNM